MAIVTLAELKAQLRVDTADDDTLITDLSEAAVDMVESWLSRPLADPEPKAIKVAITRIVADWYIHTEATTGSSFSIMPLGVQEMLAPYRVVTV